MIRRWLVIERVYGGWPKSMRHCWTESGANRWVARAQAYNERHGYTHRSYEVSRHA